MAQAADRVILTAERVLSTEEFARMPELTRISELGVAAVVEAPGGARPGDCAGCYDVDEDGVRRYLDAARAPESLAAYLASIP
jgi:glutaconate CoA-transferase subunit A